MQSELARIHRQVGTTFVFVTHDQEEALSMATTIAIMSGGRVLQQGSPREVYDHPANRFVANFVGDTNFLTGTIRRDGAAAAFELAGGNSVALNSAADAGEATLMVRPEYLKLRAVSDQSPIGGLPGRIVNIAFLGNHSRVTVATPAGDVVAVLPHGTEDPTNETQRQLGEEVCVWWHAENAALIQD
jgi:spermidine/putrescine transport system ATP-binding protein